MHVIILLQQSLAKSGLGAYWNKDKQQPPEKPKEPTPGKGGFGGLSGLFGPGSSGGGAGEGDGGGGGGWKWGGAGGEAAGGGGGDRPIWVEFKEMMRFIWVVFWNAALFLAVADMLHRSLDFFCQVGPISACCLLQHVQWRTTQHRGAVHTWACQNSLYYEDQIACCC